MPASAFGMKARQGGDEEDEDYEDGREEEDEDEIDYDKEAAKTWVYPVNLPKREYQYNVVRDALFENTLVCLPTGLGKTFIAAVVTANVGQVPSTSRRIGFSLMSPFVK